MMISARLAGDMRRHTLKPALGGVEGVVEIGAGRVRHGAERSLVGRIDHRTAVAAAPLSADHQLEPGISAHRGVLLACHVL